jgi:hypothetical protein
VHQKRAAQLDSELEGLSAGWPRALLEVLTSNVDDTAPRLLEPLLAPGFTSNKDSYAGSTAAYSRRLIYWLHMQDLDRETDFMRNIHA